MKQSVTILLGILSTSVFIISTTLIGHSSYAQTAKDAWRFSQRNISVGARMTGMSLRGFAGFGDYSAMYSNPAGLAFVDDSQLIVSLRKTGTDGSSYFLEDGFRTNRISSSVDGSGLGNLILLYDVPVKQGSMVAGVGVSQVHNYSRRLDFRGDNTASTISTSFLPYDNEYSVDSTGQLAELDDLPFAAFNGGIFEYYQELHEAGEYPFYQAVIPGSLIEQSGLVSEEGDLYEANAAIAWQATKDIMVGVSANLIAGDYHFDYLFEENDFFDQNPPDTYNVLLDDGTLYEGFDRLTYQQRLRADMVGINLRAGMSAKVKTMFRIGVTVESPTWTYIEESYGEQFSTRFDIGGEISYGEQSDDVGNGFYEYSLRSPWRLGVGLRADLGNLIFTAEGELIDWSKLRFRSEDDRSVFVEVNRQIEDSFDTVMNIAAGAELELNRLSLRSGFAFRPSPYRDSNSAIFKKMKPADRVSLSFGAGVQIGSKIHLDLAWLKEDEIDIWDLYPSDGDGPRQEDRLEIDELLTKSIVVLELTIKL